MSTLNVESISHPTPGSLVTINGTAPSNRNLIINGAMQIDQRNGGASINLAAGSYPVDRFRTGGAGAWTGAAVIAAEQDTEAPAGFSNSLKLTVSTADSSLASTDNYVIGTHVEGYTSAVLEYGTSDAKTVTLSFWVRSSVTGDYAACIGTNSGEIYVSVYTINTANTWEHKTITVPGNTSQATPSTTNGYGVSVLFDLGSGSDRETTAGSWTSGSPTRTSGTTDWVSNASATFYLTGVQLEAGSVATPFEHRSYGDELQRCERYYQMFTAGIDDRTIAMGAFYNTTFIGCALPFRTTMRSSPTIDASSGGNHFTFYIHGIAHGTSTVTAGGGTTPYAAGIRPSSAVSGTQGSAGEFKASNAAAHLAFSAEL